MEKKRCAKFQMGSNETQKKSGFGIKLNNNYLRKKRFHQNKWYQQLTQIFEKPPPTSIVGVFRHRDSEVLEGRRRWGNWQPSLGLFRELIDHLIGGRKETHPFALNNPPLKNLIETTSNVHLPSGYAKKKQYGSWIVGFNPSEKY